MYKLSRSSKRALKTCVKPLQDIVHEVLKEMDVTVVYGHRGKRKQNELYHNGYSKLKFPKSTHNKRPSQGMDIVPYPSGYKSIKKFFVLSELIYEIANKKGIKLRWGRDWDMDGDLNDQTFNDFAHWEYIGRIK